MALPLEGIRVIDWTIWQQGPVAARMLGDMGADVIKIENPNSGGDPARGFMSLRGIWTGLPGGRNFYFESNNRNKRSITIDLSNPKGREIAYRLVEKADVLITNFRHGVAEKISMDYKTLVKYNSRLIYAVGSGFGRRGPDAFAPSVDAIGLARSGMMQMVGGSDAPPQYIQGYISDQMGGIMLAYGVLAALIARERLGVGQEVETSQLGSIVSALQGLNVDARLFLGEELPKFDKTKIQNPLWNTYQCKDKEWIVLAHPQPDRYWSTFCKAVGIGQLEKDPKFGDINSRANNAKELVEILEKIFLTKTRKEWMEIFRKAKDLIVAPVQTLADVVCDPQVMANDYIIDFDHPVFGQIKTTGFPVWFSEMPLSVRMAAPELGQHTEEILLELGYNWEEIVSMKDEKAI